MVLDGKKMKRLLYTILLICPLSLCAQMPKTEPVACITIGDSLYELPVERTMTEVRPGWKIADVAQTKDKATRYVWGPRSRQISDSRTPRLVIRTRTDGTLHDFVFVRLKEKKQYRKLPKSQIVDCKPIYIDLLTFRIELLPDERYAITPLRPLEPGEYILIDRGAKDASEYGDKTVYSFTVLES